MICVAVAEQSLDACFRVLAGAEMAEIRLDLARLPENDIPKIFSLPLPIIATCRPGPYSEPRRLDLLKLAIRSGAAYADIEIEAADSFRDSLVTLCRSRRCSVIISYHNFESTPSREKLLKLMDRCFELGADIAKIACRANCAADSARILSLYDSDRPLVALGMGEPGKITRLAAPMLGAPFTYASAGEGRETAAGQMDRKVLHEIIKRLQGD